MKSSKALDRPGRGVPALLLLVDDLGEGDLGEILLRPVVENLHVFTVPNELRDAIEGDVTDCPAYRRACGSRSA